MGKLICDRCGRKTEEAEACGLPVHGEAEGMIPIKLCRTCAEAFVEWFKQGKTCNYCRHIVTNRYGAFTDACGLTEKCVDIENDTCKRWEAQE